MIEAAKARALIRSSDTRPYKCPLCRDTGWVSHRTEEGISWSSECDCQKRLKSERLIARSGLARAIREQTFDAFKVETDLQRKLRKTAGQYARAVIDGGKPWLYIGGNPGSGKTHICTAVCGKLLEHNIGVRYMQWIDEARRLKAYVSDPDFDNLVADYMDCDVLYIDDLFKSRYGDFQPSDADIRIAFTILNARYIRDLPTIITSEWDLMDDLLMADEGLFSRVYEKTKGYEIYVPRDMKNNYRLRGGC